MNIKSTLAVVAAALTMLSCKESNFKNASISTNVDSVSYAIGLNVGENLKRNETGELNYDAFLKGIDDMLQNEEELLFDKETAMMLMQSYFMARFQEKVKGNLEEGKQWLEENKSKTGVVELPSGAQYRIVKEGNGPIPSDTSTISAHYTGKLVDGKVFDASDRLKGPVEFNLTEMIPGWRELVSKMPVGSVWELYIPPHLGYGETGTGDGTIPGNAVLIFEVELLGIL